MGEQGHRGGSRAPARPRPDASALRATGCGCRGQVGAGSREKGEARAWVTTHALRQHAHAARAGCRGGSQLLSMHDLRLHPTLAFQPQRALTRSSCSRRRRGAGGGREGRRSDGEKDLLSCTTRAQQPQLMLQQSRSVSCICSPQRPHSHCSSPSSSSPSRDGDALQRRAAGVRTATGVSRGRLPPPLPPQSPTRCPGCRRPAAAQPAAQPAPHP